VKYQFDVLIVGGGVAGIAAALSAVRRGAKVGLVEKQFLLGGLATAGIVTIYLPLCDGMGHQVSYGLAEELLRLSIQDGWEKNCPTAWLEGGTLEQKRDKRFEVRFNPQLFAIAAEQQLLREGVEILYGSSACNVIPKIIVLHILLLKTNPAALRSLSRR
jgi:predicted NAD/FAD-dependent oxidoreductase